MLCQTLLSDGVSVSNGRCIVRYMGDAAAEE